MNEHCRSLVSTSLLRRIGRIALAASVAVAAALSTGCDADRAEAVEAYNEGLATFEAGGAGTASGHLKEALEHDPTFAEAAYTLGQIQQKELGEPGEAEDSYRQALDQHSDNPQYRYRLATALADQGEHEEALEHFEQVVDQQPRYARAWYQKGISQDALGEPRAAVDSLTEAITINPRLRLSEEGESGDHYHVLADLYMRYRLFLHAAEVYENGLHNNPDSARLHHGLGMALMELGRYHEAVEHFEKTLEIDADHPSANFNLGVALHEAGETDDAIDQLTTVVEEGVRGMSEAQLNAAQRVRNELEDEHDG